MADPLLETVSITVDAAGTTGRTRAIRRTIVKGSRLSDSRCHCPMSRAERKVRRRERTRPRSAKNKAKRDEAPRHDDEGGRID